MRGRFVELFVTIGLTGLFLCFVKESGIGVTDVMWFDFDDIVLLDESFQSFDIEMVDGVSSMAPFINSLFRFLGTENCCCVSLC